MTGRSCVARCCHEEGLKKSSTALHEFIRPMKIKGLGPGLRRGDGLLSVPALESRHSGAGRNPEVWPASRARYAPGQCRADKKGEMPCGMQSTGESDSAKIIVFCAPTVGNDHGAQVFGLSRDRVGEDAFRDRDRDRDRAGPAHHTRRAVSLPRRGSVFARRCVTRWLAAAFRLPRISPKPSG